MLKALAYGCAVVALDTVFNREMLDGEMHGRFFSKKRGELREAIEQFEERPETYGAWRAISRSRIASNYTWEKITAQYMELFGKMLNGKGRVLLTK